MSDKTVHSYLRACLHGGGGPQEDEVTRLGGVKKITRVYMQSCNPAILRCKFIRLLNGHLARKQKKIAGKRRVLQIVALLLSLAAVAVTFSAVTLYCHL